MPTPKLIVQKYGGATLADPEKIKLVAKRIFDLHSSGYKIVVVVSAMGQTTNQLIELAQKVSARPPLREMDMLLSVGERISMALLSMALNDLGCAAISFTGSQAGILTDDSHINANIVDVKAFRVQEALKENKVVILAGFQGVSQNTKEITTLGRGGSDITAVAMAGYLNAERCEILKDVDCVYSADPKIIRNVNSIAQMNYQHLLEMTSWGAKVLHYQSVKLAEEKNVTLFIGAAANPQSTGTTVTNHYTFPSQKILAINSFANVYRLKLSTYSVDEFQNYLQKNQIGQLQFLLSDLNMHYVTASDEILNGLGTFESKQKQYSIESKDLASVSATFTQEVTENSLNELTGILIKNKIIVLNKFKTTNSLHFFVSTQQKNEAIQCLHNLI